MLVPFLLRVKSRLLFNFEPMFLARWKAARHLSRVYIAREYDDCFVTHVSRPQLAFFSCVCGATGAFRYYRPGAILRLAQLSKKNHSAIHHRPYRMVCMQFCMSPLTTLRLYTEQNFQLLFSNLRRCRLQQSLSEETKKTEYNVHIYILFTYKPSPSLPGHTQPIRWSSSSFQEYFTA